jgi:hypothetical protein
VQPLASDYYLHDSMIHSVPNQRPDTSSYLQLCSRADDFVGNNINGHTHETSQDVLPPMNFNRANFQSHDPAVTVQTENFHLDNNFLCSVLSS